MKNEEFDIKEHNKLVNKCNNSKAHIYYNLKKLITITGLKKRALQYRMLEIKEKYSNMPTFLIKIGKEWKIHYTIIEEFMPKRNKKERNIYTFNWRNIVTWNTLDDYDVKYHTELVKQIKQKLNLSMIYYTIEKDKRGMNHVHFISDADKDELNYVVNGILTQYIPVKEYKIQITDINNKYCAISYLSKSSLYRGII